MEEEAEVAQDQQVAVQAEEDQAVAVQVERQEREERVVVEEDRDKKSLLPKHIITPIFVLFCTKMGVMLFGECVSYQLFGLKDRDEYKS